MRDTRHAVLITGASPEPSCVKFVGLFQFVADHAVLPVLTDD